MPRLSYSWIVLVSIVASLSAAIAQQPRAGFSSDPTRSERLRQAVMPPINSPVMFDTPEAEAILAALEIFPPDNPWNQVVEAWPVHPNSAKIVAAIGVNKPLRYHADMSFIFVPPQQKKVDLKLVNYPDQSDRGPFPIPDNIPMEGWPAYYAREPRFKGVTLDDVQRDKLREEGDRRAIVVDPINRMLYEYYQLKRLDNGWQAANEATFDLKSNKLRPDGWVSADTAGLPIFPAIVRYDELKRGLVEHAMRVTVGKSRRGNVPPARHFASRFTEESLPRMGERLRLRQDFDTANFTPEVRAILNGLKKYGMLVADHGIDWAISCAADTRIPVMDEELRKITGADFEVILPPAVYRPSR